MDMIPVFLKEMEAESLTTRKMLERVPAGQFLWKPHAKSMSLLQLATHVAEIPGWVSLVLNTSELDFAAGNYHPAEIRDKEALMEYFEKCLAEGRSELGKAREAQLSETWTMRNGEKIYSVSTKAEVIRMCFCQIVHHRAQLGVFLRLLDIPIPGSYGPSADDPSF
jgi:uncharacterized damage-inducible protein DinB